MRLVQVIKSKAKKNNGSVHRKKKKDYFPYIEDMFMAIIENLSMRDTLSFSVVNKSMRKIFNLNEVTLRENHIEILDLFDIAEGWANQVSKLSSRSVTRTFYKEDELNLFLQQISIPKKQIDVKKFMALNQIKTYAFATLLLAVLNDDYETLKMQLPVIDFLMPSTLFIVACTFNKIEMMKTLIKTNLVNVAHYNFIALRKAVENQNVDALKIVLENSTKTQYDTIGYVKPINNNNSRMLDHILNICSGEYTVRATNVLTVMLDEIKLNGMDYLLGTLVTMFGYKKIGHEFVLFLCKKYDEYFHTNEIWINSIFLLLASAIEKLSSERDVEFMESLVLMDTVAKRSDILALLKLTAETPCKLEYMQHKKNILKIMILHFRESKY